MSNTSSFSPQPLNYHQISFPILLRNILIFPNKKVRITFFKLLNFTNPVIILIPVYTDIRNTFWEKKNPTAIPTCLTAIPPWLTAIPPWLTATPPWLTATPPWLTAIPPWLTATHPWLTAIPPWLTATPPWLTATPPWLTAIPPWLTATHPWLTATPPWLTPYPHGSQSYPHGSHHTPMAHSHTPMAHSHTTMAHSHEQISETSAHRAMRLQPLCFLQHQEAECSLHEAISCVSRVFICPSIKRPSVPYTRPSAVWAWSSSVRSARAGRPAGPGGGVRAASPGSTRRSGWGRTPGRRSWPSAVPPPRPPAHSAWNGTDAC